MGVPPIRFLRGIFDLIRVVRQGQPLRRSEVRGEKSGRHGRGEYLRHKGRQCISFSSWKKRVNTTVARNREGQNETRQVTKGQPLTI